MEQKYFYFGVRVKVSNVGTDGRMRSEMRTVWAPKCYNNVTDAANAAAKAMQTRLGVSFFVQGFDKQLSIQADGTCTGYIKTEE